MNADDPRHEVWMCRALELAERAAAMGEVPVGAVVVQADEVIGEGRNSSIAHNDPSGHAEIVALRDAGQSVGNYRLSGATLVVTLEPCLMCVGAAVAARVSRVVFGAADPKAGCLGGAHDAMTLPFLNHHFSVVAGVCAQQCGDLLKVFFQMRRTSSARPHEISPAQQ